MLMSTLAGSGTLGEADEIYIDAATARRLAVAANCDPRTIRKVALGQVEVRSSSQRRARAVLEKEGILRRTARHAGAGR